MKNVGILTFHAAHNYGSMLQAYALQLFLERLGHDASIINYRGAAQRMLYPKPFKYWDANAIKGRIINPILFYRNIKKWNLFEQFMQQWMHLTRQHSTIGETKQIIVDNKFDAVITGGDQIWAVSNPDFYIGYFLPFTLYNCKKIAYAPSFGDFKWAHPHDYDLLIKSALCDYDMLSVREVSNINTLQSIIERDIQAMPDPAWLIEPTDYNKLTSNSAYVDHPYLFYYDPKNEVDPCGYINSYAVYNGLVAVNSNSKDRLIPHFHNYNSSGPSEFINLVQNASIIVGKSMHMVVFALLYHKPFVVISENIDTRLVDLLNTFSIHDRVCTYNDLIHFPEFEEIDWNLVDKQIDSMRTMAKEYFTKSFS